MPLKRRRDAETAGDVAHPPPSDLDRVRNMEEFAALGQYLFMFGVEALKLPDFGREELEIALLAPQQTLVEQIQLTLIKAVTLNSRLVIGQFDEQARKQYLLHKPKANPFEGDDETARSFKDMDLFTKIRVLHQLSVWTFTRPNQIREKMGMIDTSEELSWRMEPAGYDSRENEYFILDDNRLYRRTPWKETIATVSKKKKKAQTPRTGRKRRRILTTAVDVDVDESDEAPAKVSEGREWACVCISPQDWETFVAGLKGSKDEDERILYEYLNGDVLPEIRRGEELKQKKLLDQEKERQKQEAVANRKRSSRIDEKMIRRREEEEKATEIRKQEELLKRTQAEERKRDKEREARLAAHERQVERQKKARGKKIQAQEATSSRATSGDESSVNSRRVSSRVHTRKSQRSPSAEEKEDDWIFDCRCGVHGKKHAGGSMIIACDKCAVWQHLACQNLPPSFIEGDFTCERCRRREAAREVTNNSRVTIKLRIGPSANISRTDVPKAQYKNTPTAPKFPDQPTNPSQVSQVDVLSEPRHEPQLVSGHSDGGRECKEAKVQGYSESTIDEELSASRKPGASGAMSSGGNNSVGNNSVGGGPAQTSADFLLFMADPGHRKSDSQLGNGGTIKTPGLVNSVQKPPLYASYEDKYQSHTQFSGLTNSISDADPGGFVDHLSSPNPFMGTLDTARNDPPGKSNALPYHENTHTQNILAGPVRSASA